MCVPLVSESKDEILQVTMIRCADDKIPARPKQPLRETKQVTRPNEVLDHFDSDSHVEALLSNARRVIIYSDLVKHQLRCRTSCEVNACSAGLATHHFVSSAGKLAAKCTVTAPNIDDTPCVQLRGQPDDMPPQVCFCVKRLRRAVVIVRQMVPGCCVALHRRHPSQLSNTLNSRAGIKLKASLHEIIANKDHF